MRGCLIRNPGGTSIIRNEANNASLIWRDGVWGLDGT